MKAYLYIAIASIVISVFVSDKVLWAGPSDQEVLSLISAIDQNEIKAAQDVVAKGTAPDVVAYAQMLQNEHTANLDKAIMIAQGMNIKLQDTPAVKDLRDAGGKDLDYLKTVAGEDYHKAYLTAMVKGHTDALALIDQQLLPSAREKKVKDFVQETRTHVAMHLDKAKALQSVH